MGTDHKTRQWYKEENNRLEQKNYRLEACSEVKHLHKFEKEIRGLKVIIRTKDLNILQKDKEITDLNRKLFQYTGKVKKK